MKNENLVLSKRVDKGRITTVEDLESWCFEPLPFVRVKGLFALMKVHSL